MNLCEPKSIEKCLLNKTSNKGIKMSFMCNLNGLERTALIFCCTRASEFSSSECFVLDS